jgi:hypothetical protein
MEMLFLQNAAGVSSLALTPESLNALSIGAIHDVLHGKHGKSVSDVDSEVTTDNGIESHIPFPSEKFDNPLAPEEVVEILNLTENICNITESEPDQHRDKGRSHSVDKIKRTLSNEMLSSGNYVGKDVDSTIAISIHLQNTVQLSNVVIRKYLFKLLEIVTVFNFCF